jgi:hypothetical protein
MKESIPQEPEVLLSTTEGSILDSSSLEQFAAHVLRGVNQKFNANGRHLVKG